MSRRGDLWLFLLIAFGGSWGLAGAVWAAGFRLTPTIAILVGVPYMFFPALGAWVVERRRGAKVRESLEVRFRPNRWWVIGWLSPLALAFVTLGLGLLLVPGTHLVTDAGAMLARAGAQLSPEQLAQAKAKLERIPFALLLLLQMAQAIGAGPTINALAASGEELGWRGFLQREWAPLGFWKSSLLIGALWGPWHAALILQGYNYPQHPVIGVAMMTALTMLLAPLIAAVRLHGRSVVAAAIAHGSFNAAAGFPLVLISGGSDLTVGVTGLAGLLTLALANLALWRFAPPPPAPPAA